VTLDLSASFEHVHAIDLEAEMIEEAAAKPRAEAFETLSGVLGGRRKRRSLQSRLTSSR
jgi:hypothetical protein